MNILIVLMVLFSVFFAGISCLLGILAKEKRILKYIPAGVAGITSIAFIIKARFFSEGFEGLGYIILLMISASAFALSLLVALTIEFLSRRQHK